MSGGRGARKGRTQGAGASQKGGGRKAVVSTPVSPVQQGPADPATLPLLNPAAFPRQTRKGVYHAHELAQHKDAKSFENEFGALEQVIVIRFPPDIATLLRERLAVHCADIREELEKAEHRDGTRKGHKGTDDMMVENGQCIKDEEDFFDGIHQRGSHYGSGILVDEKHAEDERLAADSTFGGHGGLDDDMGGALGLTIIPTPEEDYRLFNVYVERVLGLPETVISLKGLLVELPCLTEVYKSLEGELLFKANDISQMLYVYDPEAPIPLDLQKIRDVECWEWRSGLTPGTHRIRSRKFKNFRVFDRNDVMAAEKEICDILNPSAPRESITVEAATEYALEVHLDALATGQLEKSVTAIIGPDNPILKAALDRTSCRKAAEGFTVAQPTLRSLLKRNLDNEGEGDGDALKELLRFSSNPVMQVGPDDEVHDTLEARLFGEWEGAEGGPAELEEEIQIKLDGGPSVETGTWPKTEDSPSVLSTPSPSSDENSRVRREHRHRKKQKLKRKTLLQVKSAHDRAPTPDALSHTETGATLPLS